jgi:F-type H+-transporting ATPase subunit epsilon
MTDKMLVHIVSAESEIFHGHATMVVATAALGEVGIKPQHAPFLAAMKPGQVRVHLPSGQEDVYYVSGGVLEVQPAIKTESDNNKLTLVIILADTAARAADLDEVAAHEAKVRAERLLHDKTADIDYAKARAELAQAIAQLSALRKIKDLK